MLNELTVLGNSKKREFLKIRLLLRLRRKRTIWKISAQISRWEIDAKLSLGRKEEWSNMLDEQSRWVLASGLEFSMMSPLENMMAW